MGAITPAPPPCTLGLDLGHWESVRPLPLSPGCKTYFLLVLGQEWKQDVAELMLWIEEKGLMAAHGPSREPSNLLQQLKLHRAAERALLATYGHMEALQQVGAVDTGHRASSSSDSQPRIPLQILYCYLGLRIPQIPPPLGWVPLCLGTQTSPESIHHLFPTNLSSAQPTPAHPQLLGQLQCLLRLPEQSLLYHSLMPAPPTPSALLGGIRGKPSDLCPDLGPREILEPWQPVERSL